MAETIQQWTTLHGDGREETLDVPVREHGEHGQLVVLEYQAFALLMRAAGFIRTN